MKRVLLVLAALTRPRRRKPKSKPSVYGTPPLRMWAERDRQMALARRRVRVSEEAHGLKAEDLTLPLWADDLKKLLDETG